MTSTTLDCSCFLFCADDRQVLTQQELLRSLLLSPTQLTLQPRGSLVLSVLLKVLLRLASPSTGPSVGRRPHAPTFRRL